VVVIHRGNILFGISPAVLDAATLPRWLLVLALAALALSLPVTRAALAGNEIWQEKAYLPGMSAIAFWVLTAMLKQQRPHSRTFAFSLLGLGLIGLLGVFDFGSELWARLGNGSMLLLCSAAAQCVFACDALNFLPVHGLRWLADMGRLS